MNKRLLVANVLDKIGATGALLALRRVVGSPWLPVVTFHRVLDPSQQAPYLFDEGVVDSAPDEFERDIKMIGRYFTPVGIEDVARSMDGAPLPKNPILVTFDDGYKDNIEVAVPILKRHGVKAVFFIATQYLSQRRMFWWDRINYLLKRSKRDKIKLSYPDVVELPLATERDRTKAIGGALAPSRAASGSISSSTSMAWPALPTSRGMKASIASWPTPY